MAPVIRISDEVFKRLQRYGEALVDTPSTVIERILDRLEEAQAGSAPSAATAAIPRSEWTAPSPHPSADREQKLFLAPAIGENVNATLRRGVQLGSVRDSISDVEAKVIADALGGSTELRCWAMTESRRGVFSSMRRGDMVLFTEKGSGRFGYSARILGKLESQRLGERLWDVVPNKPWKLIYLLGDVRQINVSKMSLLRELAYDPKYVVPGIVRVEQAKLQDALSRFGTLDRLLESATPKRA